MRPHECQKSQRVGQTQSVPRLPRDRYALLQLGASRRVVALPPGQPPRPEQRLREVGAECQDFRLTGIIP